MSTKKSSKKQTKVSRSESVSTDFGIRKISSQNFSKVIAIPKTAVENLGTRSAKMKVELVQTKGGRFIKLTPVKRGKKN